MSDARSPSGTSDESLLSRLTRMMTALDRAYPVTLTSDYLFGSHLDQTAVQLSDIDLCIVVNARQGVHLIDQIRNRCVADSGSCGLENLDVLILSETDLLCNGHFRIGSCSRHIWGTDIRAQLPAIDVNEYVRTYAHAPIAYLAGVLRQSERIRYPVSFPDPDGQFFGYNRRTLPPGNRPIGNVKAFVSTVCWIASIMVTWRTGRMICTKAEAVERYRADVDDGWADFVEHVYQLGKHQYGYIIPPSLGEQQPL